MAAGARGLFVKTNVQQYAVLNKLRQDAPFNVASLEAIL
jgi:hypothetical protein